jgi:RNA polymerase sigma-70 factor (ECF subfamily)
VNKTIDDAIIHGCLKKDPKAQKAFYEFFNRTMYGICLRYSNSPDDAKDILQDGFIKIFAKLDQFSNKGSLEGWLKRIFINTALEHYRVNKVYMEQSDVEMAFDQAVQGFAIEKITQKEILEVLSKMATGYRTVLNLYAIEGYTHAEIAEMLNISEGTSKSQLSRARVLFTQTWNDLQKSNI